MTAANILTVSPTLAEQREDLMERLAALQSMLPELRAEYRAAVTRQDWAAALDFDRRERENKPDVERWIADVVAKLATVNAAIEEQEQVARDAALRQRQAQAREDQQRRVNQSWAGLTAALDAVARAAGQHRRAVEALAEIEVEITGKRDLGRAVVQRNCGGGAIEMAGTTLGEWLAHDPIVQWDLATLDRLTGDLGELQRRLRDQFFATR